jgi:hypothetical protein
MGLADRFVFQQDLDPKHTASAVRDFFAAEICGSAVVVDSGLIGSNHRKSEQNNIFRSISDVIKAKVGPIGH